LVVGTVVGVFVGFALGPVVGIVIGAVVEILVGLELGAIVGELDGAIVTTPIGIGLVSLYLPLQPVARATAAISVRTYEGRMRTDVFPEGESERIGRCAR
jgi:hypothetical protein